MEIPGVEMNKREIYRYDFSEAGESAADIHVIQKTVNFPVTFLN